MVLFLPKIASFKHNQSRVRRMLKTSLPSNSLSKILCRSLDREVLFVVAPDCFLDLIRLGNYGNRGMFRELV